jgi:hypothetical protein
MGDLGDSNIHGFNLTPVEIKLQDKNLIRNN